MEFYGSVVRQHFVRRYMPNSIFLFLISAVIWLVTRGGFSGRTSDRDSGGILGGSFFDGGDGGGCD